MTVTDQIKILDKNIKQNEAWNGKLLSCVVRRIIASLR